MTTKSVDAKWISVQETRGTNVNGFITFKLPENTNFTIVAVEPPAPAIPNQNYIGYFENSQEHEVPWCSDPYCRCSDELELELVFQPLDFCKKNMSGVMDPIEMVITATDKDTDVSLGDGDVTIDIQLAEKECQAEKADGVNCWAGCRGAVNIPGHPHRPPGQEQED